VAEGKGFERTVRRAEATANLCTGESRANRPHRASILPPPRISQCGVAPNSAANPWKKFREGHQREIHGLRGGPRGIRTQSTAPVFNRVRGSHLS